jgi:hypothetical protein
MGKWTYSSVLDCIFGLFGSNDDFVLFAILVLERYRKDVEALSIEGNGESSANDRSFRKGTYSITLRERLWLFVVSVTTDMMLLFCDEGAMRR